MQQNKTKLPIFGTAGDDALKGKGKNDAIVSFQGDDTIDGGAGDDVINAGFDDDVIDGSAGFDILTYAYERRDVSIDLAEGVARIGNEIDRIESIEGLILGKGDDTVAAATAGTQAFLDSGADAFIGRGGADLAAGGGGKDTLAGGSGDDTITGGDGDDSLSGGDGVDTADYLSRSAAKIENRPVEIDLAKGRALVGDDRSGADRDVVRNFENALTGKGDDNLRGDGKANLLFAHDGDDHLHGRDGADTIAGGEDNDRLTGGGGRDVFLFDESDDRDLITDFQNGKDRLDLSGVPETDSIGDLDLTQVGSRVRIDYDGGTIYLRDVDLAEISGKDFIF